jgi:hypothetical protein
MGLVKRSLIDGRAMCVTCNNSNNRCIHRSEFESQFPQRDQDARPGTRKFIRMFVIIRTCTDYPRNASTNEKNDDDERHHLGPICCLSVTFYDGIYHGPVASIVQLFLSVSTCYLYSHSRAFIRSLGSKKGCQWYSRKIIYILFVGSDESPSPSSDHNICPLCAARLSLQLRPTVL